MACVLYSFEHAKGRQSSSFLNHATRSICSKVFTTECCRPIACLFRDHLCQCAPFQQGNWKLHWPVGYYRPLIGSKSIKPKIVSSARRSCGINWTGKQVSTMKEKGSSAITKIKDLIERQKYETLLWNFFFSVVFLLLSMIYGNALDFILTVLSCHCSSFHLFIYFFILGIYLALRWPFTVIIVSLYPHLECPVYGPIHLLYAFASVSTRVYLSAGYWASQLYGQVESAWHHPVNKIRAYVRVQINVFLKFNAGYIGD